MSVSSNNTQLEAILATVNALPEAGGGKEYLDRTYNGTNLNWIPEHDLIFMNDRDYTFNGDGVTICGIIKLRKIGDGKVTLQNVFFKDSIIIFEYTATDFASEPFTFLNCATGANCRIDVPWASGEGADLYNDYEHFHINAPASTVVNYNATTKTEIFFPSDIADYTVPST